MMDAAKLPVANAGGMVNHANCNRFSDAAREAVENVRALHIPGL